MCFTFLFCGQYENAHMATHNEIRIIGGQWKRTRLGVVSHLPDLRPTPDRVRETLFNWLGPHVRGWCCLDAFAGTGALGLEAASRGAAHVLLVEKNAQLVERLHGVCQKLQADTVQVQRGDGLAVLRRSAAAYWDLVLLDPPFAHTDMFAPALQAAARAVVPSGFVYLEAPVLWSVEALTAVGLGLHRHMQAGTVHAHLLCKLEHCP